MIFSAEASPRHDTRGVTIDFDPLGHVSDEEAAGYDYDALLTRMQANTPEENKWRAENGYQAITLVGCAEPPHCDADARKLYWAKQLSFAGDSTDTLNCNIRELGRKGVLVASFIAGMDPLDKVRAAVPDVRQMVSFCEDNLCRFPAGGWGSRRGYRGGDRRQGADPGRAAGCADGAAEEGGFLLFVPVIWLGRKLLGGRGAGIGEV